jgi:UDP-N-acetylglucosamine 2-epimerase (non-hydrolysing)
VSKKNLLGEGIPLEHIFVTGNTVIDALHLAVARVRRNSPVIPQLDPSLMTRREVPVVLITAHRRESFGAKLESICQAIARLAERFPHVQFVYPVHLNPAVRATVAKTLGSGEGGRKGSSNVHLIEPLSYLSFVALLERATLILTDSGGIQEEAPSLGKPVLVMRDTTERPEALQGGTVKLVGTDPDAIFRETALLLNDPCHYRSMARVQSPFGDGTAARRIIDAIWTHFQTNQQQGWPQDKALSATLLR